MKGEHAEEWFMTYGWSKQSCFATMAIKLIINQRQSNQAKQWAKDSMIQYFLSCKNCFQYKPGYFWAHSGVSYVKKIPVVCTIGGFKDFAITQYMTEISSVKVVTLTLGHPVVQA